MSATRPHFRLAAERLGRVAEVLREHDIQLGLEFLGSYGNRRTSRTEGQGENCSDVTLPTLEQVWTSCTRWRACAAWPRPPGPRTTSASSWTFTIGMTCNAVLLP